MGGAAQHVAYYLRDILSLDEAGSVDILSLIPMQGVWLSEPSCRDALPAIPRIQLNIQ